MKQYIPTQQTLEAILNDARLMVVKIPSNIEITEMRQSIIQTNIIIKIADNITDNAPVVRLK